MVGQGRVKFDFFFSGEALWKQKLGCAGCVAVHVLDPKSCNSLFVLLVII